MTSEVRAFISGAAGPRLTDDETAFFARWRPWGLILFKRNIVDRAQVAALAAEFRVAVGRPDAPILVDQEGGRVQRLAGPHWPVYPAASTFGQASDDASRQERLTFLAARLMAHDLAEVGISVDCLPVLDVPAAGSHFIIGDRAYATDAKRVARLGRAAADGLLAGGVLPVMKHVPGHGRARADSHLELPVVEASLAELDAHDFAPFRANADLPAAMTAHVVYTAIDPLRPATMSPTVVSTIIRGKIGFNGLLMSDDLSMKALAGTFTARVEGLFAAGVDLALHCSGQMEEMAEVAAATPVLTGGALDRAEQALARLAAPRMGFDPVDARAELADGLAGFLAARAS
jgi:beta-N-acetylhexosaminidase